MGWRKRIQSGYCKLRSQGTWREASKAFRLSEARKKDGSDYEPDSLRVMIASLNRHLKEAGSNLNISIAEDREFVNSRKVLYGKARFLREQGCKPNQLRVTKVRNFFALKYKQKIARFLRGIWDKYRLVIFQKSPNITRRGGSWYFGEFWNITRGIYPKYPWKPCYFLY